jgi:hypothetical protein
VFPESWHLAAKDALVVEPPGPERHRHDKRPYDQEGDSESREAILQVRPCALALQAASDEEARHEEEQRHEVAVVNYDQHVEGDPVHRMLDGV